MISSTASCGVAKPSCRARVPRRARRGRCAPGRRGCRVRRPRRARDRIRGPRARGCRASRRTRTDTLFWYAAGSAMFSSGVCASIMRLTAEAPRRVVGFAEGGDLRDAPELVRKERRIDAAELREIRYDDERVAGAAEPGTLERVVLRVHYEHDDQQEARGRELQADEQSAREAWADACVRPMRSASTGGTRENTNAGYEPPSNVTTTSRARKKRPECRGCLRVQGRGRYRPRRAARAPRAR